MLKSHWLLVSLLSLLACNKEPVEFSTGHDYYPISIGYFWIYEVTETNYVDKSETTQTYQIRESIYEELGSGDVPTYLMRIERRDAESDLWYSIETVSLKQNATTLEYLEKNIKYVKMSYPVKVGRTWDGNAQNNGEQQAYSYETPESNDFTFGLSDHIKVVISDLPANIVEQDERFETYAKGIGLVERNFIEIQFCQTNCSGGNEPQNGRILLQRLIEYSVE